MIALGIESTAHTFGCGIVSDSGGKCNILANEKSAYTTQSGGIHPKEAMEHHLKNAKSVIENALRTAKTDWNGIDLISFSQGPGLGPCLRVGAIAARALALRYKKPLLGVNHCIAHIEIGKALTQAKNPIIVYVSGANTQITGYESGCYRIYGETLDIGVGNLLDVFGRALGIGFPAGPQLDKMYFESQNYIAFPYTVKGMDLTFSGLLTAAENKAKSKQYGNADLAYSLLHTAFAMVTEVAERALAHTEKNEILLTGGVAASRALQQMMQKMCDARNAKMFVPPASVATDNAAMIAWLGLIEHKAGIKQKIGDTKILPMQRTDQVEVKWA
ncbi:MAG: bifunctional N(6)-L-threonylcarbamoyladenine synthase/serine/threonine protein kinase [Candidatus Diapherotrites archaeon]|nr:bifunctional N(6)-L-threonylcarbamoyladenine synthase/serine/threonine protein kinase [Candidatus Diapherotrites archaeon]